MTGCHCALPPSFHFQVTWISSDFLCWLWCAKKALSKSSNSLKLSRFQTSLLSDQEPMHPNPFHCLAWVCSTVVKKLKLFIVFNVALDNCSFFYTLCAFLFFFRGAGSDLRKLPFLFFYFILTTSDTHGNVTTAAAAVQGPAAVPRPLQTDFQQSARYSALQLKVVDRASWGCPFSLVLGVLWDNS